MAAGPRVATIAGMISFRHIRFRRHESFPRRAWRRTVALFVDVLAASLIARRFWRHRPTLLHR